jgi:hypothetical protein
MTVREILEGLLAAKGVTGRHGEAVQEPAGRLAGFARMAFREDGGARWVKKPNAVADSVNRSASLLIRFSGTNSRQIQYLCIVSWFQRCGLCERDKSRKLVI